MSAEVEVLLSPAERARLVELEATIDHGMRTFVEVGQALAEIRGSRLYRDDFKNFEDYCDVRWQLDKPHAHRLIVASEITTELVPIGTTPATESVARELAPLREEPDVLREAWAEAVAVTDGKPTAKDVREVVQQYRTDTEPKKQPVYECCPTCGQRVRADRPLRLPKENHQ